MKKKIILFFLFLLVSPVLSFAGSEWTGNIMASVGNKMLDYEGWKPVDDHIQVGAIIDFKKKSWPVSIATDIFYSWDSNIGDYPDQNFPDTSYTARYELKTTSFNVGVRKNFETSYNCVPYLGGGLAVVYADGEIEYAKKKYSCDDTGVGGWLGTGVYYQFSEVFNVGLDGRWSYANVGLNENATDDNGGGIQVSTVFGYHW